MNRDPREVDATIRLTTACAAETRALAADIGAVALPGWVILLDGPLGAGKTVFAQGVLAGLGYGGRVSSPTFTLINEYEQGEGVRLPAWHADVYRLDGGEDFAAVGGDELLAGQAGVALVEWAEKLGPAAPGDALRVRLEFGGEDAPDERRTVTVAVRGALYRDVLPVLKRWAAGGGGRDGGPACG